jgi:hypothetical protein
MKFKTTWTLAVVRVKYINSIEQCVAIMVILARLLTLVRHCSHLLYLLVVLPGRHTASRV